MLHQPICHERQPFSLKLCGLMANTLLNASYSKSCLNLLPQPNLTAYFSITCTPNLAHAILIVAIAKQANQSFLILRPVLCWQCLLSKRLRGKQACSSSFHSKPVQTEITQAVLKSANMLVKHSATIPPIDGSSIQRLW